MGQFDPKIIWWRFLNLNNFSLWKGYGLIFCRYVSYDSSLRFQSKIAIKIQIPDFLSPLDTFLGKMRKIGQKKTKKARSAKKGVARSAEREARSAKRAARNAKREARGITLLLYTLVKTRENGPILPQNNLVTLFKH